MRPPHEISVAQGLTEAAGRPELRDDARFMDKAARIRQAHTTFAWMAKVFDSAPPTEQEDP